VRCRVPLAVVRSPDATSPNANCGSGRAVVGRGERGSAAPTPICTIWERRMSGPTFSALITTLIDFRIPAITPAAPLRSAMHLVGHKRLIQGQAPSYQRRRRRLSALTDAGGIRRWLVTGAPARRRRREDLIRPSASLIGAQASPPVRCECLHLSRHAGAPAAGLVRRRDAPRGVGLVTAATVLGAQRRRLLREPHDRIEEANWY
jgi:hypothetical protein